MKKNSKTKSYQTQASATQDIVGLITALVERLVTLEAKIDTVLSRVSARPPETTRQHNAPSMPNTQPKNTRIMYTAICADCGINCEVPFKPTAGRSVYCKKCYSARRNSGSSAPRADTRSREIQPVHARHPEKPQPVRPAAPAVKKKAAAKKVRKKA